MRDSCLLFFEADQEFAKAVEPGVGALHDPASGLVAGFLFLGCVLPFALLDVRPVAPHQGRFACWFALVSSVGAQMLRFPLAGRGAFADDAVQSRGKQLHVMLVGPADDERQRDATRVHQQTALAPIFSPCRWGSAPHILALKEPCPWHRLCSASARRYPPSRRIRPDRHARF